MLTEQGPTWTAQVAEQQVCLQRFCSDLLLRHTADKAGTSLTVLWQGVVVPGSSLIASVDISVAFHTWNSFRTGPSLNNHHCLGPVLGALTPPSCWDAFGFTAEESLADFVNLPPLERVTTYVLDGPTAGNPLGTYLQLLTKWLGAFEVPVGTTEEQHIASMRATYLQNTADGTAAKCSNRMETLRRWIILLKMASLMACIKYESSEFVMAQSSIALHLSNMVDKYPNTQHNGRKATAAEQNLEQITAMLLAEMTVPFIRQKPASMPNFRIGDYCLPLLMHLLQENRPSFAIGPRLVKQGEPHNSPGLFCLLNAPGLTMPYL